MLRAGVSCQAETFDKKKKEKKRKVKKKFSDHACVKNMGKAGRFLGCIKVTDSPSPQ